MAKRIEIDGILYRKRRGKLVKIPLEWAGRISYPQTTRKRHAKAQGKIIAGRCQRAQAKDAMAHDEEPNPNARKMLK